MRRFRAPLAIAVCSSVLTAVAVVGTAAALTPHLTSTFYACKATNGTVSKISTSASLSCPAGSIVVHWNATGPQGPAGPDVTPAQIATLDWGAKMTYGRSISAGFAGPTAVAFDGTHIWVANASGGADNLGSLSELSADDGSLNRTISNAGGSYGFDSPYAVAFDGTNIWAANYEGSSITIVNASDGALVQTLADPDYDANVIDYPDALVFDGKTMWVANFLDNTVSQIGLDGSWIQTLPTSGYGFDEPVAMAYDGEHVWVANRDGQSLTEFDASNGTFVRKLSASAYMFKDPDGIAFDGTHLWVTNAGGNSVTEINPSNGALVKVYSGGSYGFNRPDGIAFDGTHLWVVNTSGGADSHGSVTEFSASNGAWIQTLTNASGGYGFSEPWVVAFDGTHEWVTNFEGNMTEITSDLGLGR